MLYRPKNLKYISAFKFKSYKDSDSYILEMLGIQSPPNISGLCQCGRPVSDHGFFNNQLLCPNTYVQYEGNRVTNIMSSENFESLYEPLYSED